MRVITIELPNEVSDEAVSLVFDLAAKAADLACVDSPLHPKVRVGNNLHTSL